MAKKLFSNFLDEINTITNQQKKFIFFAAVVIFLIAFEYAITRPAAHAIFLTSFGSNYFPYVWALSVPTNLIIISIYTRMLSRIGSLKIFFFFILITIFMNLSLAIFYKKLPVLSFIQYLWKDVYILMMYKQIWSLIHTSIKKNQAKYLYGFLFSMGGLAAVCGSSISGFFASNIGSSNLLFSTFFIYCFLLLFYFLAYNNSGAKEIVFSNESIFTRSNNFKTLKYLFLIIIFMHISMGITEFQFNVVIEKNFSNLDLRTEYIGKVFGLVNILMIFLQFFMGFLFFNLLGMKKINLFLPITITINAIMSMIIPALSVISFSLIYIKAMEHSVFGGIREMFYLHMTNEQKFKAKAFIDVFGQRSAKALSAFMMIVLNIFSSYEYLSFLSIVSCLLWGIIIISLFKKNPQLI